MIDFYVFDVGELVVVKLEELFREGYKVVMGALHLLDSSAEFETIR